MSGELNMFSTYFHYRIAILGEPRVGKTSILNQLVNQTFSKKYAPTLETDMEYLHEYKGTTYVCLIVDTAGVKEFPAMRRLSMTRSNGFIVVFDVSLEQTFHKAKETIDEILQIKQNQFINIILIGNKNDILVGGHDVTVYLKESARQLCRDLDTNLYIHCQYFELSATSNVMITNMFEKLLDLYDMKHLRESCHLIASIRNRRNRTDQHNPASGHLTADINVPRKSSEMDEKQSRYSPLSRKLFSSPNLSGNRKAASNNLLQLPDNDY